jgi:hypothetical protein
MGCYLPLFSLFLGSRRAGDEEQRFELSPSPKLGTSASVYRSQFGLVTITRFKTEDLNFPNKICQKEYFSVLCDAFTATNTNKVFPGYQPYQFVKKQTFQGRAQSPAKAVPLHATKALGGKEL